MAKKNGKTALAPMIRKSAHDIWLAGLGALSAAGEEGEQLFRQLVKRGETVDKASRSRVIHLKARARDLRADASAAFGKLAVPIDAGMTKALHRLGVPTRREILSLTKRVEDLTRAVEKSRRTRVHHSRKPAAPAVV